jgi:hypothetical protein
MIHLTLTGIHAGRRLCLASREDGEQNAHAAYAPLQLADFRSKCCPHCLHTWAIEAYEPGDDMPPWVEEMRRQIDPRQAEEAAAFRLQHSPAAPATDTTLPLF